MQTPVVLPSRFERLLRRAILDLEMHREPEAEARCREALGLQPLSAEAWFWLGRALEEQDELKGAAYSFNLGCLCAPGYGPCRQGLIRLGYFNPTEEDHVR